MCSVLVWDRSPANDAHQEAGRSGINKDLLTCIRLKEVVKIRRIQDDEERSASNSSTKCRNKNDQRRERTKPAGV